MFLCQSVPGGQSESSEIPVEGRETMAQALNGIGIRSLLNRSDDLLPWGLVCGFASRLSSVGTSKPIFTYSSQEGEEGSKVWNEVLMQNALHWDSHLSEGWGYTLSSDATLNSVYNPSLSFGH